MKYVVKLKGRLQRWGDLSPYHLRYDDGEVFLALSGGFGSEEHGKLEAALPLDGLEVMVFTPEGLFKGAHVLDLESDSSPSWSGFRLRQIEG